MAVANSFCHGTTRVSERERAVFFVTQVAFIGEFLHHASDRWLADVERLGYVSHVRCSLTLNQLMNALKIVLSTLAWFVWHVRSLGDLSAVRQVRLQSYKQRLVQTLLFAARFLDGFVVGLNNVRFVDNASELHIFRVVDNRQADADEFLDYFKTAI